VCESFTDEELATHIANGLDPYWRLKVYFWIPAEGIGEKENTQHVPYIAWRDAGHIFTSPGMAISKTRVIQFVDSEIASKYNLQGIAYDRNRMKDLIEFASKGGIELDIGEWDKKKRAWNFPGHSGIKMMPFGQEGRSMAPAIDKFELFLLQKLFRHDGNPCLNWNVASAVIKEDDDSYRKVMKNKSTGKVDGLVATIMACGIIDDGPPQRSAYEGKSLLEIRAMRLF
jgi:phage terminase large subunit-like protein